MATHARGKVMKASPPPTTPLSNTRPPCSECGAKMWLTRIEPDRPGYEIRTFACTKCGSTETVVAKYD